VGTIKVNDKFLFFDLCKKWITPCLSRYNFKLTESKDFYIRYESEKIFVILSYDLREGELYVRLGELADGKYIFEPGCPHEYFLSDILYAIREGGLYKEEIIRDYEDLERELRKLCAIFTNALDDLFKGNGELFAKAFLYRKSLQEAEAKRINTESIRKDAEQAFKEGKFDTVISLYNNIKNELTLAEKKRFEIAAKHIGLRE